MTIRSSICGRIFSRFTRIRWSMRFSPRTAPPRRRARLKTRTKGKRRKGRRGSKAQIRGLVPYKVSPRAWLAADVVDLLGFRGVTKQHDAAVPVLDFVD